MAALLALVPAGCVDISGGAVELSWALQDREGAKVFCVDAQVARIELCATPTSGTGTKLCDSWACGDGRGTTDFDIPEGRYALAIEPICSTGTLTAIVPEPIVRDIVEGDVASLRALLIVGLGFEGRVCS